MKGHQLEVAVEPVSDADITAVVHVERGLHEDILADMAHQLLQNLFSVLGQRVERSVLGEVFVVLLHEFACSEAAIVQFWDCGVIAANLLVNKSIERDGKSQW
jgi:hypothetical protein